MIDVAAFKKFAIDFQGQIVLPENSNYDEARRVWNGLYDKYPAAIACCTTADDVVAAVNFARDHKLTLAVRGGGHDYAGNSVCDGGLVIDLSAMNQVTVDPDTNTAQVQGGATWGTFDDEAQKWRLATTGGTVSSIGVGGLTLGGGTGFLARKYGMALDNLLSAEIVTAAGRLLHVSHEQNSDLFWAIRGGGGNFGVVTSFRFQLHAVGPEVLSAQLFYPHENSPKLLRLYRDFMANAPRELQCFAFFLQVPPVAPFPEQYHGKTSFALIACYAGALDTGKKLIQPLLEWGTPFLEAVQPIHYAALQKSFDAGTPKGLRWYTRAHYLPAINDEVIGTLKRFTETLPGPFTMAYLEPLGGAIRETSPTATAFPHREAAYSMHILPGWSNATDDEKNIEWAKDFFKALEKHATGGVYVNLLSHDEKNRVKAAYGENYERLAKLKSKWDPDNIFGVNQNILPDS